MRLQTTTNKKDKPHREYICNSEGVSVVGKQNKLEKRTPLVIFNIMQGEHTRAISSWPQERTRPTVARADRNPQLRLSTE